MSDGAQNARSLAIIEIVNDQTSDHYIRETTNTTGKQGFVSSDDNKGVLIRHAGIDDAPQNFVFKSLQSHIFYLPHYPVLADHSVERGLYDTLHCKNFRPDMAKNAYTTVPDCQYCAAHGTRTHHQK